MIDLKQYRIPKRWKVVIIVTLCSAFIGWAMWNVYG